MTLELPTIGSGIHGRSTHLLELGSWSGWPASLVLPSPRFCVLLAATALDVNAEIISALAASAIKDGCAYVCGWGPECEFVHDVFDETYLSLAMPTLHPTLMTSWHAEATLGDALSFLLTDAIPDKEFEPTCRAVVATVIANPGWADVARSDTDRQPKPRWRVRKETYVEDRAKSHRQPITWQQNRRDEGNLQKVCPVDAGGDGHQRNASV